MKNLTQVLYRGKVDISLKIGDKTIRMSSHNNGLPYLQRAFCNFIVGNMITIEDIPEFLDLRKQIVANGAWQTCLLSRVHLSGKSWSENTTSQGTNECIATFTGVLAYMNLKEAIPRGDTSSYRLYLYSGSLSDTTGYDDMAYLDITADELSRISPGTQAIVEWSMKLLIGEEE